MEQQSKVAGPVPAPDAKVPQAQATQPDQEAMPPSRRRQAIAGFVDGLLVLRGPLIMGLLVILVLSLPDQAKEVYRVLALSHEQPLAGSIPYFPHRALAIIALLALSIVLWQLARELSYAALSSRRRRLDLGHPIARAVLSWGPRVIATMPLLGAALGLLPSGKIEPETDNIVERYNRLQAFLEQASTACLMAAIGLLALTTLVEVLLQRRGGKAGRRFSLFNNWFLVPTVLIASLVLFATKPIELPQKFGTLPIFAFWAANIAALVALCTWVYDAYRIPLLSFLAAALIVFEVTGWSDNHRFRTLDKDVTRPVVREALADWLRTRGDIEAYRKTGKPYPVYVFTAEGGGLYAALHAAKFLARIQDLCPGFAQHVFAISAVSGGGLGAAVFTGLLEDAKASNGPPRPCSNSFAEKGSLEKKAESILDDDFLSPVIWHGLFPDFLQRFVPKPFPQLDRALSLELSFEHAWRRGSGSSSNPFAESMFGKCTPGVASCPRERKALPALVLNMTNVDTGAQMVVSPIRFNDVGPPITQTGPIYDIQLDNDRLKDLRLSTAVGLSARFPWVTPVGWHELDYKQDGEIGRRRMGFVDGGYFESSGASTGDNLARLIRREFLDSQKALGLDDLKLDVRMIMITAANRPMDQFVNSKPRMRAYSDTILPLATLLKAWSARSSSTQFDLQTESDGTGVRVATAEFDPTIPLPTGWQLASLSRDHLDRFIGRPQDCDLNDTRLFGVYKTTSSCIISDIQNDLDPSSLPTAVLRRTQAARSNQPAAAAPAPPPATASPQQPGQPAAPAQTGPAPAVAPPAVPLPPQRR